MDVFVQPYRPCYSSFDRFNHCFDNLVYSRYPKRVLSSRPSAARHNKFGVN